MIHWDLSEAIDVALQFKDDLEDVKEPEQIMYKETEKAFEDEINPFEKEAWKASLSKGELDEFEKAKHVDGDMHPNGKWVWRQSANGGKGDWRVASPSKRGGGTGKSTASTKNNVTNDKVQKFMDALKVVSSKYTDENKVSVIKTPKGNWDVSYDGHRVGTIDPKFLTDKIAKEKDWLKDDNQKKLSNTITHDINGTKVTVSKNTDGSYTLEVNGKKFKSDDPSFFRDTLKPSVKKALAKEVGI